MAERRSLRNLSARAQRMENARVQRCCDLLYRRWGVAADASQARRTLNFVVVPTSSCAAPAELQEMSAALAPQLARVVPVVAEDRLYLHVARRNAPSDRAVGLCVALLGLLMLLAAAALTSRS